MYPVRGDHMTLCYAVTACTTQTERQSSTRPRELLKICFWIIMSTQKAVISTVQYGWRDRRWRIVPARRVFILGKLSDGRDGFGNGLDIRWRAHNPIKLTSTLVARDTPRRWRDGAVQPGGGVDDGGVICTGKRSIRDIVYIAIISLGSVLWS